MARPLARKCWKELGSKRRAYAAKVNSAAQPSAKRSIGLSFRAGTAASLRDPQERRLYHPDIEAALAARTIGREVQKIAVCA